MFLNTCSVSRKNLTRNFIFLLLVFTVFLIVFYHVSKGYTMYYDPLLGETITDTDDRYVMSKHNYDYLAVNTVRPWVLFYIMPLFTTFSVSLLLRRDYTDEFFEIERSSGLNILKYVCGRLLVLVSVNLILCTVVSILGYYTYYFTRGGFNEFHGIDLLSDSFPRLFFVILGVALPSILFYIGITYFVCSLMQSSLVGCVVGVGVAIIDYLANYILRFNFPTEYLDYVSPLSAKQNLYFGLIGTDYFEINTYNQFTTGDVAVAVLLKIGVSLLCLGLSYFITRKRNT